MPPPTRVHFSYYLYLQCLRVGRIVKSAARIVVIVITVNINNAIIAETTTARLNAADNPATIIAEDSSTAITPVTKSVITSFNSWNLIATIITYNAIANAGATSSGAARLFSRPKTPAGYPEWFDKSIAGIGYPAI